MIKIKKACFAEHVLYNSHGDSFQALPHDKLKNIEMFYDYAHGTIHVLDMDRNQVFIVTLFKNISIDMADYIAHFRAEIEAKAAPQATASPVVQKRRGRKPKPILDEVESAQ